MKKWIKIITLLFLFVFPFTACDTLEEGSYRLTVTDHYGILNERLETKYQAGVNVEVHIQFHSGPRVGGLLNFEAIPSKGIGKCGCEIFEFTMPKQHSVLAITLNGYFNDACENDRHRWNQGIYTQFPNGEETLLYTCLDCGESTTNANIVLKDYRNALEIGNINSKPMKVTADQYFSLEVHKVYPLYLYISDTLASLVDLNEIQFVYTEENADIHYESKNDRRNYFQFNLYPSLLAKENALTVRYKEYTYTLNYSIVDFDFEKANAREVALSELENYPEFKETIDSISYFSFEAPYGGLTQYDQTSQNTYVYRHSFKQENNVYQYDVDYLPLLTDSLYYPTKVSMVNDNPISTRQAILTFDCEENFKTGNESKTMARFEIVYSVIDPGCTKPKNPLQRYYYSAIPLNYTYQSDAIEKENYHSLQSGYYALSKKYQEKYLFYRTNNVDMKILLGHDTIMAFFIDQNYAYLIHYSYLEK